MLTAVLAIGILAALFGLLLGYSAIRFKVEGDPIVEQIDAILPQTQCGQGLYGGFTAGRALVDVCFTGGDGFGIWAASRR